jgi:hypothetical protein
LVLLLKASLLAILVIIAWGEDKLTGKRTSHALLWESKGQLMNLKAEVDRALISVLEGLKCVGLALNSKVLGIRSGKSVGLRKIP